MATNAWVDWSQLPPDISRKITKEAISGPGSYEWTNNMQAAMRQRVPVGESFHPMADAWTPTERLKYAFLPMAALASVGFGASKWSKGETNMAPDTRKAQQLIPKQTPNLYNSVAQPALSSKVRATLDNDQSVNFDAHSFRTMVRAIPNWGVLYPFHVTDEAKSGR